MIRRLFSFSLVFLLILLSCGCSYTANPLPASISAEDETKTAMQPEQQKTFHTVTDMRGMEVAVPVNPERIVLLDTGFITQTVKAIGVPSSTIAATGGLVEPGRQTDTTYLIPSLQNLPRVTGEGGGFDIKTIADVSPDLVLLYHSPYVQYGSDTDSVLHILENELQLPVVVIRDPAFQSPPLLEHFLAGIYLLGNVFQMEERASEVAWAAQRYVEEVEERTEAIPLEEQKSVLYITSRDTSRIWGEDSGAAMYARYASIQNASKANFDFLIPEDIPELNPDLILLAGEKSLLGDILARFPDVPVVFLGGIAHSGNLALDVPSALMIAAKAAYPHRFADIPICDWLNDYHCDLYYLTVEEAEAMKAVQNLTWMDQENF